MLEVGTKAQEFSLPDQNGEMRSLSDYKGQKVILYFYPKDMTSGCTSQACTFGELFPQFREKGAVILGVSKDTVASHKKFEEKYGLPFTLLSDTELENVSGGGCYTSGGKLIVTCGHSCEHWTCISCGCGLTRITVRNKDFPYGHEHAYHQDYWHYSTGYCKYKGSDDDLTCKNCKYYDYEGGVFVCNNPKRYS